MKEKTNKDLQLAFLAFYCEFRSKTAAEAEQLLKKTNRHRMMRIAYFTIGCLLAVAYAVVMFLHLSDREVFMVTLAFGCLSIIWFSVLVMSEFGNNNTGRDLSKAYEGLKAIWPEISSKNLGELAYEEIKREVRSAMTAFGKQVLEGERDDASAIDQLERIKTKEKMERVGNVTAPFKILNRDWKTFIPAK